MRFSGILHASLIVADTNVSLVFYRDILGFTVDHGRPDLGYPGAWLNIGPHQIHLLQVRNPDPVIDRPKHGGRDRHTAIGVNSITALTTQLEQHTIAYTLSRSGRAALFCRDPDGNALEFVETNC